MIGGAKSQARTNKVFFGCRTLLLIAVVAMILVWRYSALSGITRSGQGGSGDHHRYVGTISVLTPHQEVAEVDARTQGADSHFPLGTSRWTKASRRMKPENSDGAIALDSHTRRMSLMETILEDLEMTLAASTRALAATTIPEGRRSTEARRKPSPFYLGTDMDVAARFQIGRSQSGNGGALTPPSSLSLLCLFQEEEIEGEGGRGGGTTGDRKSSHQQNCQGFFDSATVSRQIEERGRGGEGTTSLIHPIALAYQGTESLARAAAQLKEEADEQHPSAVGGQGGLNRDTSADVAQDYDFISEAISSKIRSQVGEQGSKMHNLALNTLQGMVLPVNYSKDLLQVLGQVVGLSSTPASSKRDTTLGTTMAAKMSEEAQARSHLACPESTGFSLKAMFTTDRTVKLGATVTSARALQKVMKGQSEGGGGARRGVQSIRQLLRNSVVTYIVLEDFTPVFSGNMSSPKKNLPANGFQFLNHIGAIVGNEQLGVTTKDDTEDEGENDGAGIPPYAFDPPTPEIIDDASIHCAYKALSPWQEEEVEGVHKHKAGFSLLGATILRFTCEQVKESSPGFQSTCANLLFGGGFGHHHHHHSPDVATPPLSRDGRGGGYGSGGVPQRLLCNQLKPMVPLVDTVVKLGTKTAIYKGSLVMRPPSSSSSSATVVSSKYSQREKVVWKQFDPLQYSTFADYRKLAASPFLLSPLINHPVLSCLAVSRSRLQDETKKKSIRDAITGLDQQPSGKGLDPQTSIVTAVGGFVWQAQPFLSSEGNLMQYLKGLPGTGGLSWPHRLQVAMDISCVFLYLHSHPLGVFTYDDNHPEQYLISASLNGNNKKQFLTATLIDIDTLQLAQPPRPISIKGGSEEGGGAKGGASLADQISIVKTRDLKQYRTRCRCFFCKGRSNCLFINTVNGLKDCGQWKEGGDRTVEKYRPYHSTPRRCDASSDLHFIAQLLVYLVKGSAPWPGKGLGGVVKSLSQGKYPQAASGDTGYDRIVEDLFSYANRHPDDDGAANSTAVDGAITNTADLLDRLGALCGKYSCGHDTCPALLDNPLSSRYHDVLG